MTGELVACLYTGGRDPTEKGSLRTREVFLEPCPRAVKRAEPHAEVALMGQEELLSESPRPVTDLPPGFPSTAAHPSRGRRLILAGEAAAPLGARKTEPRRPETRAGRGLQGHLVKASRPADVKSEAQAAQ